MIKMRTQGITNDLKKILSRYGIELIEISRRELDRKAISATTVRE